MKFLRSAALVLIFAGLINVHLYGQAITINEVMADPAGADYYDEFIELYNSNDSAVNLAGMSLTINDGVSDLLVVDSTMGLILQPGSYALIMEKDYLLNYKSTTYDNLIPDTTLLITISTAAFGSGGLLNTSSNDIRLVSLEGDTLSSVVTTPNQSSGYSDEKIIPGGSDDAVNWGNSQVLYGTPGFRNSISPRNFDVAVCGLKRISPVGQIAPNEPVEFVFVLKNVGLQIADDVRILFGADKNADKQIDAILFEETLTLPPGDSVVKNVTAPGFASGSHKLLARVIFTADELAGNDMDSLDLDIAFTSNCLIINEFMYCPATDGGGEWVELLNISGDTLNLKNWTIADNNSDALLTEGNFYLSPQDYLVLVNDSTTFRNYWGKAARILDCQETVPVLNNTKDSIVIRDHCRNTIDGLEYSSSWGYRQGASLERKNPFASANQSRNWTLSTDEEKATPGRENSEVLRSFDLAIDSVTVMLNAMPVIHGSPVSLMVYVRNSGIEPVQQFAVALTITNPIFGLIADTTISVISVLAADETQAVGVNFSTIPGGLHSVTAEVELPADEVTDNDTAKCNLQIGYKNQALIINEIMYIPASGEPEWFEIYNPQSYPVDLNGWSFRNAKGSWIKLADSAIGLAAKGFTVVAENPEFLAIFPDFDGVLIVPSRFPSLKNTADSLFLSDATESLVETVFYKAEWGGGSGVSIERRNPYHTAAEQANWSSSRAVAGCTPGAVNSNLIKEYDLTLQKIMLQPVNKPLVAGDPISCEVTIVNTGLNEVTGFALAVQLSKKIDQQSTVSFFDTTIAVLTSIQAEDSAKLSVTFSLVYGGVFDLVARTICAPDADNTNDFQTLALKIGYPPGAVVINEIMFAPVTGQGEWFEIYNNSDNPIDLNQWKFRDALGNRVALADSFIVINAGGFAVVAARPDFGLDYPDFEQTLILPKSFPTLNNASDSLFLYDAIGQSIDSVCYRESWGGGTGISLERLDPYQPALASNNWSGSLQQATPGQINSVIKLENDLAIVPASFQFADTLAAAGMTAEFSLIVKNKGQNPAGLFLLKIYADRNRDGTGQDDELCWIQNILNGPAPDSLLRITGRITAEKSGRTTYLAEIDWSKDNNPDNNFADASLIAAFPSGCVTLNEFLPYPVSNQVEFVECINIGGVTVDLTDWSLGNKNSKVSIPSAEISSGGYVVFSGDSAYFNYFQTTDATIIIPEKWPGLNNSADQIWLKDLTGKIIDSLAYGADWPIKTGFSAEKILPELASIESESWTYSVNSEHQTAGYLNSVTRPENDLSLDSLRLSAITGDTITVFNVRFFITNAGQNRLCDADLKVCLMNSLAAEIVTLIPLECLNAGQADSGVFQIGPLASGKYDLVVRIMCQSDQVAGNDFAAQTIQIAWPEAALLLSEFMPYPYDIQTASSSIAEYLEIYNPGQIEIDLTDWLISDQNTAIRRRVPAGFCLPAGEYFIIAGDSSILTFPGLQLSQVWITSAFPSLNNTEDAIFLYDPTERIIDSLFYNLVWDISQGIAMERISFNNSNRATNWRASVAKAGGTPGKVNSVALNQPLNKTGIELTTAVFSPDGDGRDDEIGLRYRLPYPSAQITLEIYDLVGRLIYRPAKNLATAAEGVIYWNGDSIYGDKARVGIYLVRCYAGDAGSSKSVEYITTFVLAR